MKKLLTFALAGLMLLSATACSADVAGSIKPVTSEPAQEEIVSVPETITVQTLNAEKKAVDIEVPYNPERIAVMDLAVLDILDNFGMGERVVGVSKGSSIDYLQSYVTNDEIINLGTIKEADMEAVMECAPDIIFIGGRLASQYDALSEIAPVIYIATDAEAGVIKSINENAMNIAKIFGVEAQVADALKEFDTRIDALKECAAGKTAIVGMVNAGGFSVLGNDGRCSIIGKEIGFENIGVDANIDTSTHGNEASFEFVVDKNPDYIFAMDRDAAIGTEGAQLAGEVLDNELVNMTNAAKNGNIIVLKHSNVWYTAEGGITALDVMLGDLEDALLK